MPSLKTFRLRIRSVQSTQKITKAMKMVAAAKLRRAQEQAMAARPYAEAMDKVMATLASSFKGGAGPKLPAAPASHNAHLLIAAAPATAGRAVHEFEPDEAEILAGLLPRKLTVQIFRALPENAASFFGSQMTAMDSATRNAGDMIKRLTLQLNRSRQASITKELIEIISGAEAV